MGNLGVGVASGVTTGAAIFRCIDVEVAFGFDGVFLGLPGVRFVLVLFLLSTVAIDTE